MTPRSIDRRTALGTALAATSVPAMAISAPVPNLNRSVIDAYIAACVAKDVEGIGHCLAEEVVFIGPMAEVRGREPLLKSFRQIFGLLERQVQRRTMVDGDKALMIYDFVCADPIGNCRTAEYDELVDGKIARIELFYDARRFEAVLKSRQS